MLLLLKSLQCLYYKRVYLSLIKVESEIWGIYRGGEGRRVSNTYVFLCWRNGINQLIILIHIKSCNQKLLFNFVKWFHKPAAFKFIQFSYISTRTQNKLNVTNTT